MSVIDTRLESAISEIKEWGRWGKIKANRQMYYPNLSRYKTPGNPPPSLPCITLDRACYVEGVIMSTKEDVGERWHKDVIDNLFGEKTTRQLADERGVGVGTMNKNISETISYFAGVLITSDRANPDAPKTIFFY